ncbi:MAG: HPP family protein [Candidatus Micrarchaeia archaeon]
MQNRVAHNARRSRMRREEKKAEHRLRNVGIPALLAALSMLVVAYALHYMNFDIAQGNASGPLIFASMGASAFILFMTPRAKAAHISKFAKSYTCAGLVGYFGFMIRPFIGMYASLTAVVLIATIVLVLAKAEHPPAVGIAVAFVLYNVGAMGILVVILGMLLLIVMRILLEKAVFVMEHDVDRLVEKL